MPRKDYKIENIGIGSLLARYKYCTYIVVHVFVLVSMLGRGTIGNKFWIMDQPSLRQGQHRAIVLLRQDADDDNAIACMLLLLHPGYLKTILF